MTGVAYPSCRFCGHAIDPTATALKYSVRHYAHYECYYIRRGLEGLRELPTWKVEGFPALAAMRLGIFESLSQLLDERKRA